MLKYGEEDVGCPGMNVVDMGDTTGDDKYSVRTQVGGEGRTEATLLLSSSRKNVQHEKARRSGAVLNANAKCVMKDMRCLTHDCILRKMKVKDKRRGYIDKKEQFGWKYSSRTRLICSYGGDTSVSQDGLNRQGVLALCSAWEGGLEAMSFHLWRVGRWN